MYGAVTRNKGIRKFCRSTVSTLVDFVIGLLKSLPGMPLSAGTASSLERVSFRVDGVISCHFQPRFIACTKSRQ